MTRPQLFRLARSWHESPQGINDSGMIVGDHADNSGTHGFLYNPNRAAPFTNFDDPFATGSTVASGINSAGRVVGYYDDNTGNSASTMRARSSGSTLIAAVKFTASFTAAASTPPSTIPRAPAAPLLRASTARARSSGMYLGAGGVEHGFVEIAGPNPSPSGGTTADMILRGSNTSPNAGQYEIYDIGNNAILAGYSLGQIRTDWQFVGLGPFFDTDTTDVLLRSASTGSFEVYDISNNNITNAAFLGSVGLDWQVMGFGNFSSRGETDVILRNSGTGGVEVYDIRNNQITDAALLGTVGLNWQFSGVGNFSGVAGDSPPSSTASLSPPPWMIPSPTTTRALRPRCVKSEKRGPIDESSVPTHAPLCPWDRSESLNRAVAAGLWLSSDPARRSGPSRNEESE
jgi:hypothetical protein